MKKLILASLICLVAWSCTKVETKVFKDKLVDVHFKFTANKADSTVDTDVVKRMILGYDDHIDTIYVKGNLDYVVYIDNHKWVDFTFWVESVDTSQIFYQPHIKIDYATQQGYWHSYTCGLKKFGDHKMHTQVFCEMCDLTEKETTHGNIVPNPSH